MKEKIYALNHLRQSRAFVLVTEEESMMHVDFDNLDATIQLVALKLIHKNLGKSIKEIERNLRKD